MLMLHRAFFLWQELPLKHPERMRSSMPQAAFYGDWGVSPTSRKSLSCHESPACRRVDSKKIVQNPTNEPLEPIQIEAEKEIVEATDTINCFIDKINSAMIYSANAVEQSKNASIKLEEITDEFDVIINELTNSAEISVQLNKSEDIVIQTQEELISSTKKLQELKNELDKLLNSCKIK